VAEQAVVHIALIKISETDILQCKISKTCGLSQMLGALGSGYLMKEAMMSGHELIEILIEELASLYIC